MARPTLVEFEPKVLTANDLIKGDVVYLSADERWVRAFSEARVFTNHAEADQALLQAEKQQDRIISVFLSGARINSDGQPEPIHLRERFRANGPSNRFLGKQAQAKGLGVVASITSTTVFGGA